MYFHNYSLHELLDGAALEEGEALQVRGRLEQLGLVRVLVKDTQREKFNHLGAQLIFVMIRT